MRLPFMNFQIRYKFLLTSMKVCVYAKFNSNEIEKSSHYNAGNHLNYIEEWLVGILWEIFKLALHGRSLAILHIHLTT